MRFQPIIIISLVPAIISLSACSSFYGEGKSDPAPTPPPVVLPPKDEPPPGNPEPPPLDGSPNADEVTEQFGVFVAPATGLGPELPESEGSRAKPFHTIARGIDEAAKSPGKRVYACVGSFAEAVTIKPGVSMIGGFDCALWKKTPDKTRLQAPSSPAVTAVDVSIATRFEGFEVFAPDGTAAAPSAIALRAERAGALTVATCKLFAGRGKDGSAGSEAVQLTLNAEAVGVPGEIERELDPLESRYQVRPGGRGGAGMCTAAGAANIVTGDGGRGGASNVFDCSTDLIFANPYVWVLVPPGATTPGLTPGLGAPATAGTDGASALVMGSLSAAGYTLANGSAGTNGTAGRGGDGGAGAEYPFTLACTVNTQSAYGFAASGSGGGAGGCPGLAGGAGQGGGASIGALIAESAGLVIEATEISSSIGGAGGRGAFGSNPTTGGAAGPKLGSAFQAGAGEAGGRAGVSGNGAGGPSLAIAWTLGEPMLKAGTTTKAGTGGPGVSAETVTDTFGNTKTRPASASGLAQDVLAF